MKKYDFQDIVEYANVKYTQYHFEVDIPEELEDEEDIEEFEQGCLDYVDNNYDGDEIYSEVKGGKVIVDKYSEEWI